MSDRKDADFRFEQVVDNAVREPAHRQPSHDTAPNGTKARLLEEQGCGALKLRDERVAKFFVRLARVEPRALDQFSFRLARKRQLHESARRAR